MEHGAPVSEEDLAVRVRELQRRTDRAILGQRMRLRACRPRGGGSKVAEVLALRGALARSDGGVVLLRLLFRLPHPPPAKRVRLALLGQGPARRRRGRRPG